MKYVFIERDPRIIYLSEQLALYVRMKNARLD
jgi:hypothetical protein